MVADCKDYWMWCLVICYCVYGYVQQSVLRTFEQICKALTGPKKKKKQCLYNRSHFLPFITRGKDEPYCVYVRLPSHFLVSYCYSTITTAVVVCLFWSVCLSLCVELVAKHAGAEKTHWMAGGPIMWDARQCFCERGHTVRASSWMQWGGGTSVAFLKPWENSFY